MDRYEAPLPKETTRAMFDAWWRIIKRRESGMIVSLPCWDRYYRVAQFLLEKERELADYRVAQIQLQAQSIDSEENLMAVLGSVNKQTVVLIMDGEWLLTGVPHLLPVLMKEVIRSNHRMSVLTFMEGNPESSNYYGVLVPTHPLRQNELYSALYNRKDVKHFVHFVSQKMGVYLWGNEFEEIWHHCGGFIWLAKEIVRHYSEAKRLELNFDSLQRKVELIWDGLGVEEREVLVQLVKGEKGNKLTVSAVKYLVKVGLLCQSKGTMGITVSLVEGYIQQLVKRQRRIMIEDGGGILIGDVAMTRSFSSREQNLIRYFVRHEGEVVDRETIGELVWPDDEDAYSDWALNQLMKRLRGHLGEVTGFEHIRTIKGKGFRWE